MWRNRFLTILLPGLALLVWWLGGDFSPDFAREIVAAAHLLRMIRARTPPPTKTTRGPRPMENRHPLAKRRLRMTSQAPEKVVKTDAEWRKILTPMQFRVTRKKWTERAGTGIYAHTKNDGIYHCICCGEPLFDSKTKFESGTGWPSFFQPLDEKSITRLEDTSDGGVRIEVQCSRCDAHLGHVFTDGPKPTGLRFCMNSASLKFVDRKKEQAAKEAKSVPPKRAKRTDEGNAKEFKDSQ